MDLNKIGAFISEKRKQKGLTQQELAEKLSLSNKTISKWECGKGIPEVSIMVELCDILGISVNELLFGENISSEEYKVKADENIISLIREPKVLFKKNVLSVIYSLVMELVLVAFILLCIYKNVMNGADITNYIDLPALLIVLGTPIIILIVTGLLRDFLRSYKIGLFLCSEYTPKEREQALFSVEIVMISSFFSGIVISVASFIHSLVATPVEMREVMHVVFAIDILGVLYGGIICLLIVPVLGRLYRA